jgi:hypothetical protein
LALIVWRCLGPGITSAPLYREVAAFTTVGIRGGVRVGRHGLLADLENAGDGNYRGLSWGVDGGRRRRLASLRRQVLRCSTCV